MSNISISEASRQLSQIINRASYGREVVFLTSRGKPKAVLMGIEAYQQLLGVDVDTPPVSQEDFEQEFRRALEEAGYRTTEDIVNLVREVKKEIAEEKQSKAYGENAA